MLIKIEKKSSLGVLFFDLMHPPACTLSCREWQDNVGDVECRQGGNYIGPLAGPSPYV
jgi:hypothetical protein